MALPKLTVKLFPPKPGKSYSAAGNLTIPISDVHAFAEWLLGQAGEYDDYLKQDVVRLLAFEYHNSSRGGNAYRTVQLRDPADLNGPGPGAAPAATPSGNRSYSTPPPGWTPAPDQSDFDDDIPF